MPDEVIKMSEMDLLVHCLKEALMVLVREGLITEDRAAERANNQAMGLGAYFDITRHHDEFDVTKQ